MAIRLWVMRSGSDVADLSTLTEGGETLRCELRTTISRQDSWDTEIRGPASERMDYVRGGGGASYLGNTGPAGLAVHVYQELVALAFEQIRAGALKREGRTTILSCQQSPSPGKVRGDGIQRSCERCCQCRWTAGANTPPGEHEPWWG